MGSVVNRSALLLAPKKPLMDWVNSVFAEDARMDLSEPIAWDNMAVYMIPEFNTAEDVNAWLKENFSRFFEDQLFGWCQDPETWPEKLTWSRFNDWFHVSWQSLIVDDLEDEPLEREGFDDSDVDFDEFKGIDE